MTLGAVLAGGVVELLLARAAMAWTCCGSGGGRSSGCLARVALAPARRRAADLQG